MIAQGYEEPLIEVVIKSTLRPNHPGNSKKKIVRNGDKKWLALQV